jgi:hypothetical protein
MKNGTRIQVTLITDSRFIPEDKCLPAVIGLFDQLATDIEGKAEYLAAKREELTNAGFIPLTDNLTFILIESREIVTVYTEKAKEFKARLMRDGADQLFWMLPKCTRRGWFAFNGDYVLLNDKLRKTAAQPEFGSKNKD